MTPKQMIFIAEYMKTLNATQAAINAGYSKHSAHSTGWKTINVPSVKEEIKRRLNTPDAQPVSLPPKPVRKESRVLYLIRDVHFGRTKIGIAANLNSRLGILQTGSPIELYVYAYFDVQKAYTHEAHLHERYSHKRLHGEWFDLSDHDLQTICDYLGGYTLVKEGAKDLQQAKLL